MNLSDKTFTSPILASSLELNASLMKLNYTPDFFFLADVREAVKELKERIDMLRKGNDKYFAIPEYDFVMRAIDEVFGEKLI